MRRLKKWTLLLCTLLLTATGAALPWTVSTLQDARVERAPETRHFDPVNLKLQKGDGKDVRKVLRLLSGSYSDLDYTEWTGSTNLTETEAAEAARDTMQQMSEAGIFVPASVIPQNGDFYAEPHLIISMDETALSALIWVCYPEKDAGNWIFIDDQTGKMVRALLTDTRIKASQRANMSISGSSKDVEDVWLVTAPEESVKRAELWRQFLSEYYGMSVVFSSSGAHELYDASYGADGAEFALCVGPDQDDAITVRLEMYDTAVYFNP